MVGLIIGYRPSCHAIQSRCSTPSSMTHVPPYFYNTPNLFDAVKCVMKLPELRESLRLLPVYVHTITPKFACFGTYGTYDSFPTNDLQPSDASLTCITGLRPAIVGTWSDSRYTCHITQCIGCECELADRTRAVGSSYSLHMNDKMSCNCHESFLVVETIVILAQPCLVRCEALMINFAKHPF